MSQQLVTNIGQLATWMSGKGWNWVTNAEIIIENGRFREIGSSLTADASAEIIDARGGAVVPGFVDAHTHFVFAGNRVDEYEMRCQGASYQAIAASGGGIQRSVALVRAATQESLNQQATEHLQTMIAHGTTTAEVKTGYAGDLENELKMLAAADFASQATGVQLKKTFLGPHALPPECTSADAYMERLELEILPEVAGRCDYADMFVETDSFTPDHARHYRRMLLPHGLGLRLHLDQLGDTNGAALAAELGAVSGDHLEYSNEDGLLAMHRAGVIPVVLPASVLCLGRRHYPNVAFMRSIGMPVVLATDFNPGSSPTPSLPFCMTLACTMMGMSPAEAFLGSTYYAAMSLGLQDQVGSIEVGKRANFNILSVPDYREVPYWAGLNPVRQTFIDGIPAAKPGERRPV